MSNKLKGIYYYPATSQAEDVDLVISGDVVNVIAVNKTLVTTTYSHVSTADSIPGVPFELLFKDGGKFIAKNSKDRLPSFKSKAEKLESNWLVAALCVLLVPCFIWIFVTGVIPKVAQISVRYLPESVSVEMGDQSFYLIEKAFLEPSDVDVTLQNSVKDQWQSALSELDLSSKKYRISFYRSDYFGANAFALPNGRVVVTDDLLLLLKDKPDAMLAVLLHEIAHVEYQHSLRIVANSMANTVAIAVVFGDLDGFAEVFLGVGAAMWESAFSRDMETQADDYALKNLVALGKPASAFAQAMQSLMDLQTDLTKENSNSETDTILHYLSTHPDIQDRINKAKAYR